MTNTRISGNRADHNEKKAHSNKVIHNDRSNHTDRATQNDRTARNDKTAHADKSNELMVEGRNAVAEALKSGSNVDKLYVQEGEKAGPVTTIIALAKNLGVLTVFVPKEKLDTMSTSGRHQGVILNLSAVRYAEVDEILDRAKEKGESPFIFVLDGIEDPHNLGAIIRTANLAGAHGVIIPKHRSATVNATVARCSAGAVYHTLISKVTNIGQTIDYLKEKGIWFFCADMDGRSMYELDLKGPIGLVIGNEGEGVSRLVRDKCDFTASIPMRGDIDSLNASVAAGILAWEVVRQNLT